ncbi:MAG: vWA domain-containing protein [Acidobacteriota bacterium]
MLLLLAAAACGGGNSASEGSYPTGGGASADAGAGGGVSFGGAQDFGQFRQILDQGGIPGPDTLDANGFFNEHYAPPPTTTCTDTLCMTPGVAVGRAWLDGTHQAALQLAVDTNVDPTQYTRLPMNLVVVVDHSGSMWDQNKMVYVKQGLSTLVDNLQDGDHLALVQFDDTADVLWSLSQPLDRAQLHTVVDGLTPRGGTNIYDGLQTGFNLSASALASDHQNRVIFLSDGMATVGNTDTAAIITMADGYVSRGIGLTTVGVGSDFDVELMRGLAEHGAGNFYFLEDASAATEVFMQELDYFLTPLALDLHVDAVAGPGYDFGEVVGSTLWQSTTRAGSMSIPAVFVASRTSPGPDPGTGGRRGGGSMLFIALQPNGMNDSAGKVADLTLTYRLPGSGQVVTQTVTLAYPANPTDTPDPPYLSAPEMAPRFAMYNMFLGFRYATQQQPDCAAAGLTATRAAAAAWNQTHENPDIASDLTYVDKYLANLKAYQYQSEPTLATCAQAGPTGSGGYGSDWGSGDYYGGDYEGGDGACSAGGSPRALALVALGLVVALRRRRR